MSGREEPSASEAPPLARGSWRNASTPPTGDADGANQRPSHVPEVRPGPARVLLDGAVALVRNLLARPLSSYYLLLGSGGLLLIIGLVMVFSATSVEQFVASGSAFTSIEKQGLSALVGLAAFWVGQRLPVRTYRALAKPGLILAFALIITLDVLALLDRVNVLRDPK